MLSLIVGLAMPVYAANQQAYRLRYCLQNDHMYYSETILNLNVSQRADKDQFKKDYDDRYIVLSGVKINTISNNKKEITITDGNDTICTVDTSDKEIKEIIGSLSVGDYIIVYGKLSVKGIGNDSYEIEAEHVVAHSSRSFQKGIYVFYSDDEYNGVLISDLSVRGNVKYRIPSTWNNEYVKDNNNNNGVKGYQYYLNAIAPINKLFPENFYIFYFENETYIVNNQENPSESFIKDVESKIVKNILQDDDRSVKIEVIKDANGNEIHYYHLSYQIGDYEYNLEFVFKPDKKGITCMLYLYYPNDAYVNHTRDVAYLIETMTVE